MAKENHKELVRAHVLGDMAAANAINDQIPGDEREEMFGYLTAFYILMLQQRFGDTASPEDIRGFADEMRQDYADAEPPINPSMIEAALGSIYGDEAAADQIPMPELIRIQFMVIAKIALQTADVVPRLDEYLEAAAKVADQWSREG